MANTKTYFDTYTEIAQVADSDLIVVQTGENSDLRSMAKTKIKAIRQPIVDMIASAAYSASYAGSYVSGIEQSASGAVRPVFTRFDTSIGNQPSNDNAPTSKAVKDYVAAEITGTINNNIDSKINGLDVPAKGGDGKYISRISEANGKIGSEEKNFDSIINDMADNNNAPTTLAAKSYIDSKINTLNLNTVGGEGKLVQSVTQNNGKVTATSIQIDSNLSSSASKIPTSKAVKDAISGLNGNVGNSNTLIKSISESGGVITGVTIPITNTVLNDENTIPTAKAVYEYGMHAIDDALSVLNFSAGASNAYVKTIKQEDGQLSAEIRYFDTEVARNSEDNAPSTKAVKAYVDAMGSGAAAALAEVNYTSSGANGKFVFGVNQNEAVISEVLKDFENNNIASVGSYQEGSYAASYSSRTDTAPTVRAVARQIERIDSSVATIIKRIDDEDLAEVYSSGAFIAKVSQDGGQVSASTVAFKSSIAASTTEANNIAPTEHAVRQAINALDIAEIGSSIGYIKYVSEADGKISARYVFFDQYTAASGWTNNGSEVDVSNSNSPSTLAVENRIEEAKREILEQSKAITYEGKVNSLEELSTHAPFAQGDTFVAGAEFNLINGGSDPKYAVHIGSMIITKEDSDTLIADNFDIVAGSADAIFYGSTDLSTPGNFAMFSDSTGRTLVDSGENVEVFKERVSAASTSASLAASAAACAASSAIYASDAGQIYVDIAEERASAASTSASYAASSATVAKTKENEASSSANKALISEGDAASSATAASQQASYSASYANLSSTSASYAASSATVAKTKENEASSSANVAFIKGQEAYGYSESASTSAVAASNSAVTTANHATSASTSASYAASSAILASQQASSSTDSATLSSQQASYSEYYAEQSEVAKTGSQNSSSIADTCAIDAASSATLASYAASWAIAYKGDASAAACGASSVKEYAEKIVASEASRAEASESSIASEASSAIASEASRAASAESTLMPKAGGTFTGDINFGTEGYVTSTGVASFAGGVSAESFNAISSRKLKENIHPTIVSALDVIDSVDIVDFNYINDDEKTPHVGFIAEDTDKILSTPHQNKMDYTNCIGVLLKAVQEITKGIASLAEKME